MSKIVYIKCLCTSEQRQLAIKFRSEGFKLRITDSNKKYKDESQAYGFALPFAVIDGVPRKIR